MNYKKNGDPFINYLSITPIHDSKGHVTHFMGIQSDISDLVNHKKAEMAAKHEAAQARAASSSSSPPSPFPSSMLAMHLTSYYITALVSCHMSALT